VESNELAWLGRVVDKKNGIFYNKNDGYFQFTIEDGKTELDKSAIQYLKLTDKYTTDDVNEEKTEEAIECLSFSGVYLANEFIKRSGLFQIISDNCHFDIQTFLSLIIFKLTSVSTYNNAYDWWNETYTRYLYPQADLEFSKISGFLSTVIDKTDFTKFFDSYFKQLKEFNPKFNVVIDAACLKNSYREYIAGIFGHKYTTNTDVKLITAVDSINEYPVYFNSLYGDVVDIDILKIMYNRLKANNIDVVSTIVDDKAYSDVSYRELINNNIPFITKIAPTSTLYKDIIANNIHKVDNLNNHIEYNNRSFFMKKIQINITKSDRYAYAYICLDIARRNQEKSNFVKQLNARAGIDPDFKPDISDFGVSILISTLNLANTEVLPAYFSRNIAKVLHDYIDTDIDLLYSKLYDDKMFAGHIFISFLAGIVYSFLDKALKRPSYSVSMAIDSLNRHSCLVYDDFLLVSSGSESVNEIYRALKIKMPTQIKL
jgi:hypothetical protein